VKPDGLSQHVVMPVLRQIFLRDGEPTFFVFTAFLIGDQVNGLFVHLLLTLRHFQDRLDVVLRATPTLRPTHTLQRTAGLGRTANRTRTASLGRTGSGSLDEDAAFEGAGGLELLFIPVRTELELLDQDDELSVDDLVHFV